MQVATTDLEIFLNILRTKPWFVERALETGEDKLVSMLFYGWLKEGFTDYTLTKTGKFYDSNLNPFDPVVISEYFDVSR